MDSKTNVVSVPSVNLSTGKNWMNKNIVDIDVHMVDYEPTVEITTHMSNIANSTEFRVLNISYTTPSRGGHRVNLRVYFEGESLLNAVGEAVEHQLVEPPA